MMTSSRIEMAAKASALLRQMPHWIINATRCGSISDMAGNDRIALRKEEFQKGMIASRENRASFIASVFQAKRTNPACTRQNIDILPLQRESPETGAKLDSKRIQFRKTKTEKDRRRKPEDSDSRCRKIYISM